MPYQTHHVHRVCGGAHRGQWARGHASRSGTQVWAHGLRHLAVKGARRASKCVGVDKERAEDQHAERMDVQSHLQGENKQGNINY